MSNIWRRSISVFLAMAMVFSLLPLNALATETGDQIEEETQAAEPVDQTKAPEVETTEAPAEATQATEPPTEEATEAPEEEVTEPVTEPAAEETKPVETVTGSVSAPAMDGVAEETTEATEPEEVAVTVQFDSVVPSISDLPSDEELFAAYANNVLYGKGAVTLGTAAYDALEDDSNAKLAYDALKPYIQDIAAGKRGSAIITLGEKVNGYAAPDTEVVFDGNDLGQEFQRELLNALLADMPYDLYWFDKISGISYGRTTYSVPNGNGTYTYKYAVTFYFCVSGNYDNGVTTELTYNYSDGTSKKVSLYCAADTSVTSAASAAAATAETVATTNVAGKTDYEKLVYFKDYICGKVSYDYDAANSGNFSEDDDPWQLIHVFDDDSTTNVVCEGYAKAFQYLCDLADFENDTIRCYSVTGSMIDDDDAEPHMWNIVTIDGKSYMVDVTNTDKCEKEGYVNFGEDGTLFLSGTFGSIADGYTFTNTYNNTAKFTYTYTDSYGNTDATSTNTWGSGANSILNLSETRYVPPASEDGGDIEHNNLDDLQSAIDAAAEAGEDEYWINEDLTLYGELTLPENFGLYTGFGVTIMVPEGETLDLPGLSMNGSTLNVEGTLNVNGALFANNGSYIWVAQDAALNLYSALHVGFYKDANRDGYAGVLDVGGTMNVTGGYLNVSEESGNSGGILNVYNTLNIEPTSDGWGGFLDVGGTVWMSGNATLNVTINGLNNGGVAVNSNGFLGYSREEGIDQDPGAVFNVQDKSVTVVVNRGATVEGVDNSKMIGIYLADDAEELADVLENAPEAGYAAVRVEIPSEPFELDRNITIPEGVELRLWHYEGGNACTIVVPEGKTLTNNGEIIINAECRLEIRSGAELVNNGSITLNQFGQLYNGGTISGDPGMDGISGDGDYIESTMSYADLKAALANCQTNGTGWVHESETTLEGDLEIKAGTRADGSSCGFYLTEGGKIIVPDGCTLTISSPTYVEKGQIIVEDGGTLHVNGLLEITEGTVIVEDGGNVTYGENAEVHGVIVEGEVIPEPYLLGRELHIDDDGTGWYENFDEPLSTDPVGGVPPYDSYYVIFYLNEWDAEKQEWVATPVVPTTSDGELYSVNKLTEDENELIREGQPNAEYFVRMDGYGDLHHTDTTINVGDLSFDYNVWSRQMSFYTKPEATVDNLIRGHEWTADPSADNVFYAIFNEPENFTIYDWGYSLNTWGEDYNAFVPEDEEFITVEAVEGSTGIYKITVNQAFVQYTQYTYKNFNLLVTAYTQNNDGNRESWTADIWINPPEQIKEPEAWFFIDGEGYNIYDGEGFNLTGGEDFAAVWVSTGQYDDWGNEICEWTIMDLPEGISYDIDTNTMTLSNTELESLQIQYHYNWWNDLGEASEGWDLPNANFTLNLIGANSIVSDWANPLYISGGVNATITGDGSLYLKADNGTGHQNDEGWNYSFDALTLDESSLTIAGNAKVTAEIAGIAYWDHEDGTTGPAQLNAVSGCGTSDLTVKDNAVLTTVVPDNAVRGGTELTDNGFQYIGINGFTNFTVQDNAEVNTTFYNVSNNGSFNLNGGTVNIEGLDYVWTDGEMIEYTNEGIFTEAGTININGGVLNIDATSDPAEGCSSYFHGIATDSGTVNISGGTVNITSSGQGKGIKIAAMYNEDGTLSETVGAKLNISGGELSFTSTDGSHPQAIHVFGQSTADISGGVFNITGQVFLLEGISTWKNATMNGDNATFITGRGFTMDSGKLYMTNQGYIVFGQDTVLNGGTIDLDNSIMEIYGGTNVNGTKIEIDIDDGILQYEDFDYVLQLNSYLAVNEGADVKININISDENVGSVRLNGINVEKNGTFHQMGGEVTVNDNTKAPAMASYGDVLLNGGVLNLNGYAGLMQVTEEIVPESNTQDHTRMLFVSDTAVLNAFGQQNGINLYGVANFVGGTVNAKAEGIVPDPTTGTYPVAVVVCDSTVATGGTQNTTVLNITGGNHTFTSVDAGNVEAKSVGMLLDHAPVELNGGTVTIHSEMAIDSVSDSADDTNFRTDGALKIVSQDSGNSLSFTTTDNGDGTYFHTLKDEGNVTIAISASLADFLANTQPNEDGRYKVDVNVYVGEDLSLVGKIVDIMPGAILTVKSGAVLTIDEDSHLVTMGGSITVENGGKIDNCGILANDGGSIIVADESGYVHNGTMNTHFHSAVLNETSGILKKYQNLIGDVDNAAQLAAILALAGGYNYVDIWTASGMNLDVTIPENVKLSVDGQESIAVLNVADKLIVNGDLALGNVSLNIAEGAALTNNGGITVWAGSEISVSGSLVNNGIMDIRGVVNGTCGDNMTWMLRDGILTISGSGTMMDYADAVSVPWNTLSNQITKIHLSEFMTSISANAFANVGAVTVQVPESVSTIGDNAFGSAVTLKVYHGSAALTYAEGNNIAYILIHDLVDGSCSKCDYSINGKTVEEVLKDDNLTTEQKVEEVKKTDTEALKTEMEKEDSVIVEQIEELEKEILENENNNLTVDAVVDEDTSEEVTSVFTNVSKDAIVGAALNAKEDATEVKLVIGDAAEDTTVDETKYDATNGVVFSMTLEGVEDASNLAVPVKITLPVPAGIDTSRLKVLHYHDGTETELNYTLSEDGKEVSFILTGFSDFAFVNELGEKDDPVESAGTITDNGRTLSLDGVIYINQYVLMDGFEGLDSEYIASNGGMLIWSEPVEEASAVHGYGTPDDNQGLIANILKDGSVEYMGRTDGIVVKKYADECYMRVYLKLEDGSYVYGPLKEFSVQDYCEGRILKSSNEKLKNVCAAMLHLGAAAQTYFGYNTEDLANASILESYPIGEFDSSLLTAVEAANSGIKQSAYVTNNGRTLSLDGAIVINYYFGVTEIEPVNAKLLFWEGVEGELTPENATGSTDLTLINGEYFAQSREFAAKEYGTVIYACACFEDAEGNVHYSDVTGFSPEEYAAGRIEKSSNEALKDTVKRMVTYGEYARIYFEE